MNSETNKVFIYLSIIAIGVMLNTTVFAQKQNEVNPFIGLWKSEKGSIIKIDGNQGILIETPSEQWKEFINKITIKDIRQKDDRWLADEWLVTPEGNLWVEALWELNDNEIKRFLTVKGNAIETYFTRIADKPGKESRKKTAGVGFSLYYASIADTKTEVGVTPVSFEADKNIALGLNLIHYFNNIFSLELAAEYFKTDVDINALGRSANILELRQYSFLVTGRFHLPLKTEKISPYLGLGAGYYVNDFDSTVSRITANLDNSLGVHVKVGSEFIVAEQFILNLELMYIWNEAEGEINIAGLPLYSGDMGLDSLKFGIGLKYFF